MCIKKTFRTSGFHSNNYCYNVYSTGNLAIVSLSVFLCLFSPAKKKQKLCRETADKLSRSLPQQFGQSTSFPWGSADFEDMGTWFQTKVQEMQRKMQRKMAKMEEKLEKTVRDCRKSRRECRELKQQVRKMEFHRTASDPSSCGTIHMTTKLSESFDFVFTPAGQSISMSILPRGNSRDSMFSCSPLHPQETLHSVCQPHKSKS